MLLSKDEIICREDLGYPEGALVCDGYDTAGALLAHPLGGGFQMSIPAHDERRFRAVAEAEKEAALFRRGNFAIADCDKDFPGWANGETWNGWEKPRFGRATSEDILKWIEHSKASYDVERDAFITVNEDGEEEVWPAESIAVTDGTQVTLYGLGAGSWTWDCV